MNKFCISILFSIIITGIGFIIPIEKLIWFCLIIGVIGFGLKFIDINITDLTPLIIIVPISYILLTIIFTGNLNINILENIVIFSIKIIPLVYICNIAS